MALKADEILTDDKSLGIKIEGELEDFQVIEDNSDSDDDKKVANESSRTCDHLSIPSNLLKPINSPSLCDSVAVINSAHVDIGNRTYFNGPVTIIQRSGLENPSYVKSEDEDIQVSQYPEGSKQMSSLKSFHIQRWHKITFSAICIIILGGIFAIISIIVSHNNQNDGSTSTLTEDEAPTKTNYMQVVGLYYENLHLIIFTIILMPLMLVLMFYTLLTLEGTGRHKKKRDPDSIEDDFGSYMRPIKKANPLIIAPNHLRIVSRTDWLAQPVENELVKIRQPVPWVIISHTATESCNTQSECVLRVRLIQMFHIESKKWDDIGYNFLVAGDGSAYFGRGWDYVGAHTLGYNKYSIGISFIGTFNNDPPPKKQLDACIKLLDRGVALGKLAKNYKLFAHRQLASTLSPGDKLFDIIQEWPHFVKNFTDVSELLPDY